MASERYYYLMTRAAVYTRISSDPGNSMLGVKRQEADCRQLAERKGWQVVETYTDNDVSAYSGKRRPAYEKMLADLEAGTVNAVIAYDLDRLHRSPKELERFFDVVDAAKVKNLATVSGDIDLGTNDGRLHARILGAVARKESDDKVRRLRRKHEELAAAGRLSGGGHRPFGFEPDRVTVRKSEAKLIREAAKRILAGDSIRAVCVDWNARGIPPVVGTGGWRLSSMRRLLRSARIAGLREHHGKVVAEAVWPAIIDRPTFDRLQAVLTDPARLSRRSARAYLLTGGLAYCALCGAKLVARPRGDGKRCYVCASGPGFGGCGKIRALSETLEEFVVATVLPVFDTPALIEALAADDVDDDAADELAVVESKLGELSRMWAADELTRGEWATARKGLEARQQAAQRRLASQRGGTVVEGFIGDTAALERAWPTLSLDRQRAVLEVVLDRVTVDAAVKGRNFFDPDRVGFVWRV